MAEQKKPKKFATRMSNLESARVAGKGKGSGQGERVRGAGQAKNNHSLK